MPALQRAQSVIGRAARADLGDAPSVEAALPALAQAADALAEAPPGDRGARLGALLWAVAAYARAEDLDAESALREQTARFIDGAASNAANGNE